jgi:hypothetical protein
MPVHQGGEGRLVLGGNVAAQEIGVAFRFWIATAHEAAQVP